MKPPKTENKDYEKVPTEDFVSGSIEEVAYDMKHTFKGYNGAEDKVRPAVRFKFKIDGLKFPHYSRWMTFNYGEKSNLLIKYLVPLVEGAKPDMDFDVDALKGMKVKMLWNEKNGFQAIETIRPMGKKIGVRPRPVHEEELPSIPMGPDGTDEFGASTDLPWEQGN